MRNVLKTAGNRDTREVLIVVQKLFITPEFDVIDRIDTKTAIIGLKSLIIVTILLQQ